VKAVLYFEMILHADPLTNTKTSVSNMFSKNFRNSIQSSNIQFLKTMFRDKHQAYDTPSLGGVQLPGCSSLLTFKVLTLETLLTQSEIIMVTITSKSGSSTGATPFYPTDSNKQICLLETATILQFTGQLMNTCITVSLHTFNIF
jgi:hypothetical protein